MDIQAGIMDEFCAGLVGKTLAVLCESTDTQTGGRMGRSYMDSPDIDGLVYFSGSCEAGDIVNVRINAVDDGNLIGEEI
jgi:ribosomal protein S12 methylthiotransferase